MGKALETRLGGYWLAVWSLLPHQEDTPKSQQLGNPAEVPGGGELGELDVEGDDDDDDEIVLEATAPRAGKPQGEESRTPLKTTPRKYTFDVTSIG